MVAERERVVAVGLLTERELAVVGQSLRRVYRIDETPCFDDLLSAIDDAECRCGAHGQQTVEIQHHA